MGFKYPELKGWIPKIKVQRRIGEHFSNQILNKKSWEGYENDMVGRTAGFVNRSDALDLLYRMGAIAGYDVLVKEAKLTVDLMKGEYTGPVIAGKHIEFLE
jgi:hypothetical protein